MSVWRFRIDGFLVAIVTAVIAAALAPQLGARGGVLHIEFLTAVAVALVFFLHGAMLPLESLRKGIRNFRLHLVCQGSTYLFFPAVGSVIAFFVKGIPSAIGLGFFFMSTVSSTISSAVAMTALAGGDVGGALFNATLSGMLGVVITPIYATAMAHTVGVSLSLASAIKAVAIKILLPLAIGQLSRPALLRSLERNRALLHWFDRGSIVLIVYGAFCESVSAGVWSEQSFGTVGASIALAILVMLAMSVILVSLIWVMKLDREAAITAYFCGSQKSLANGLPTAYAIFAGSGSVGLIVMPLLIYHQVQLAIGAVIARRLAQRKL
jgi:sodium/bile acid cotransporter 7